jgi:hypothetical protein
MPTDDSGTGRIQFDLLDNAVDSIEHAVESLAWKDTASNERRLKQAILGVAQGVELLLKERLRRVHPSLIWEDVDKYPSLDARTVGADKALSRLRLIGGVELTKEDELLVKALRRTRNAIEHFEWHTSISEAKSIIGPALSFAIDFARVHLDRDLAYRFKRDDTWVQLLEELHEFAVAYAHRLASSRGSSPGALVTCEHCEQPTLDSLDSSCPLCGHWNSSDEAPPF